MKGNQLHKNIFGVLLFFLVLQMQSQVSVGGTAEYTVQLKLKQNRGFSDCNGEGGLLEVKLEGSYIQELFNSRFNNPGGEFTLEDTFTKRSTLLGTPTNFTKITFRAESTENAAFGRCKKTDFHNREIFLGNSFCYYTNGKLSFQHANDFDYDLKIFPIVTINQPNNSAYLTDDEFLTITLPDNIDARFYNWEYAIGTGGFNRFPNTVNGRTTNNIAQLRIRGDEFLTDNEFGKVISIRANPNCSAGTYSNTIALEYLKSAPRIIRAIPTDVSCYDAIDGTIRLTFDGPLDPVSKGINIVVEDLSNQIGTDNSGNPLYATITNINGVLGFDASNSILISNLLPSKPGFNTRIRLFGEGYYTDASGHTRDVTIHRPDYVSFDITNTIPVWCRGGQDGEIVLQASGGTTSGYQYTYKLEGESKADDWKPFSGTTTHTIKNLPPGKYEVKVMDSNQCLARIPFTDPITGEIKLKDDPLIRTTEITQPDAALQVTTKIVNQPTAFGFEDGRIQATITGGTLINGNSYTFEWRDESNTVINTTTAIYNAGQGYLVTLHSVGDGSYQITIKDANYNNATDRNGCIATSEKVRLTHPPKLKVRIEIYHPISCNNGNAYSDHIDTNIDAIPDQFQDGALIAFAEGGVPFDTTSPDFSAPYPVDDNGTLLPYFFNWKQQLPNGNWVDVPQKGSSITFLSTARYALNIMDKNKIILGTYTEVIRPDGSREYELVSPLDESIFLPQPDKLTLNFNYISPSCSGGNDASATVQVSGGIPPYTYSWSNGETTDEIADLIGGKYVVFITDAKGCQLEGQLTIDQPGGIEITPTTIKNPTCVGYNDGALALEVKGGTPPYTYQWVQGSTATVASIDGIAAGTYRLRITDDQGCTAFYEETLKDPDPVVVNLGEDRSLCLEQSLLLDITINDPNAQYNWFSVNGFSSTSPTVEITQPGEYTATVTTGIGCVGTDTIMVNVFDIPIDARFLITTQAYTEEEVILINLSEPTGDRVVWTVPDGVKVVSENKEELIAIFPAAESYDIHLRSYQGDCYQDYTKAIIVEPAIPLQVNTGDFIEEFIIYPNPNGGTFKTKITLAEDANIVVKIINLLSGATVDERSEKNKRDFLLNYSVSLPSGVYFMLLETPKGSEIRKLVIE
ncbi:T9SS type A sorting domain-containing protein [Aquimarina muelleri]|uniref:T9SS type A sorting domain-containing protein n=1 Tax=Aquimarina muelleri TaxID=279356 RepID=UPI003F682DEA